ncbi:MAG TPA: S9 family peptidase [Gemmatimonadaceae bacterium]|nr:S9 family peptidase [Gemmatimonadaceae bacterium]
MSWSRLVLVFSIAALQHAAAKIDLSRVTPVPADKPVPIEDFFRPLLLQQPTMNPAGTHVAAIIAADEDQQHLLVHDLKTLKNEFFASAKEEDIHWADWAGDSRVIFAASSRKRYGLGLFGAEVGNIRENFPILQSYGAVMLAIPHGDRAQPLVWLRSEREQCAAILNTKDLGGRLGDPNRDFGQWFNDARKRDREHIVQSYPEPEPGITYRYLADREGRAAFAFNSLDGDLTMFRLEGRQWVKCPIDLEAFEVIGAGNDPGTIVVRAPKKDGKPRALHFMNAATGEIGELLFQDNGYDFDGWLFRTRATNEIVGVMLNRDGPRTVWFTEEHQALQKILNGFFPGKIVRVIESDDAQGVFLVAVFSDRQPVIYNLVDLGKRTVGLFKSSAPWIDPERMQPVNIIKFKTRDGRRLDAYLTLPAGASKEKPAPLVVIPHGGPFMRDTWGFDAESQFLASRGYAVLKPNYRGSTGYGWMFTDEEEWDFLEMHEDVTAATKALAASGFVDPDRIAIMGGSFGGYLAVSGVANEPGLYRCAVTIAGVFDWERQIRDEKYFQYDSPQYARMVRKLGDPKTQREKFDAMSPIRRVDRIRVPVFVAGGKEDLVVEISQSKALIDALERHDVPHEKLLVREEGHGMAHLENQVELYGRIEAFLAKHLAPRKTP